MTSSGVDEATAPARWLLDAAAGGVVLTQTNALARTVVREAAERWTGWWDAELFGAPYREADLAVLNALHEGLRRLRLVRRRGRRLYATARGRELSQDPATLLAVLATDLGAGDAFTEAVAAAVTATLAAGDHRSHDDLGATALARVRRGGWRDADGRPPTERDVTWVVGDVVCRGEAYGLIERHPDPTQPRLRASRIALSASGRALLGVDRRGSVGMTVLVFDAELCATVPCVPAVPKGHAKHAWTFNKRDCSCLTRRSSPSSLDSAGGIDHLKSPTWD